MSSHNSNFGTIEIFPGSVTSSYNALEAQFQRTVAFGLQALASYTWSHSIDFGSTYQTLAVTRGNADFDVRHSFIGGITWDIPATKTPPIAAAILSHWGIDSRLLSRTGFPITLNGAAAYDPTTGIYYTGGVNLIAGRPLYLHGFQYPGGRALNGGPSITTATAAIVAPGAGSQGNAPRNYVRGFGATQINMAVRRDLPIAEHIDIQFRAEAFNILNHPNFGYVDPGISDATFGQATKMLNQSLGTVASQYQQGGARSMQFALKLIF
jgi:hypothetical protein